MYYTELRQKCSTKGIKWSVYTREALCMLYTGIVVDFGKKKHLKKAPFQGKKTHIFSKRSTHFTNKKQFWSRKKHLVNIILLTKSNSGGEKKFYFYPNFFWLQSSFNNQVLVILSDVFVISSNVIDQFLYSFLYFSQSL